MTGEMPTAASVFRTGLTDIWAVVGRGPLTSVLICDDRPSVLQCLFDMLRPLPALVDIDCVTDGFALVDAFTARRVDLVLNGIRCDNNAGIEATTLLLSMHPTAVIVVFGSPTDIDVLAAAYTRGASGLLPWDPDQPAPRTRPNSSR